MHTMIRVNRTLAVAIVATTQVCIMMLGLDAQSTPVTSRAKLDAKLLADLVVANHILALEGVVDSQGHVSMRSPTNPAHYFMSRARAPELVTEDDIMELDLDS